MQSQIVIDRTTASMWNVTFDHPPINLIDLQTIRELSGLLNEIETDENLKVVVFRSANPDFFLAHWDVLTDKQETAQMPLGPTGLPAWPDILVRLSRAPVVSIAQIRGRARGAGSEFVLACDMRFASEERGILGQFEVAAGAVPGGNPMARLVGLAGRGRTLEIILGGDDFHATLAERYGYINRAIPDAQLEHFVTTFSKRLASFEKYALTGAKHLINDVSLPSETSSLNALKAFRSSSQEPANHGRITELLKLGLQTHSQTELTLGDAVAGLSSAN